MASGREANYHFKRLTSGAPPELLALLGEAMLAVDAQRRGAESDASALLRRAWLELSRWLIQSVGVQLNEQQCLFLLSGALGDEVALKSPDGERVTVALLPADVYEGLLASIKVARPPSVLTPRARMAALSDGRLTPLDLKHPGRYRESSAAKLQQVDVEQLLDRLAEQVQSLENVQQEINSAARGLAELMKLDNLRPVLEATREVGQLVSDALAHAADPQQLSGLSVPAEVQDHPVVRATAQLKSGLVAALEDLLVAQHDALQGVGLAAQLAKALVKATTAKDAPVAEEQPLTLSPQDIKLVESDYASVNGVMTQLLINSPRRTAWSASRVLLAEHTERFDDPLASCYATPERLGESIAKIDALHPNCFPHDDTGSPLLPPVIVEPGVGEVKWYDDRFVMSFVCSEPARKGGRLSLSPVDLAVIEIYAQFLARGEMYNYRGERVTDNFIGEYAGEVEQKAAVKFTGEKKKLTYATATEVRDAASREDAIRDYIDFVFHVFNGMALPKRITPRRIGVLLKYCIIGDEVFTAALALKHVANNDVIVAREILNNLTGGSAPRVVELAGAALESDPQLASRYGREVERALHTVMGPEFTRDAAAQGLINDAPDADSDDQPAEQAAAEHNYFDV